MKVLAIDHSVVAQAAYHRIFTDEYKGRTNDDRLEFASSYLADMMYLYTLHQPDVIYILTDCPRHDIWRHDVIREYYLPRTKIFIEVQESQKVEDGQPVFENGLPVMVAKPVPGYHYLEIDNYWSRVRTDADGTVSAKVWPKKKIKELTLREVPQTTLEQPTVAERVEEWYRKAWKTYKGSRDNQTWRGDPDKGEMDREEWKKLSFLMAQIFANHMQNSVQIRLMSAPRAEADDLAYLAATFHTTDQMIYCTTDKDWLQLVNAPKGDKFWYLKEHKFIDAEPKTVSFEMAVKIMHGDSSDDIPAMRSPGKKSNISKNKAKDFIDAMGYEELWKWLGENGGDSYERNVKMICLCQTPIKAEEIVCHEFVDEPISDHITETEMGIAVANGQKGRIKL